MGYEINSELRIRYYSPVGRSALRRKCPQDARMWFRINKIKKFRPTGSRKKMFNLGRQNPIPAIVKINKEIS